MTVERLRARHGASPALPAAGFSRAAGALAAQSSVRPHVCAPICCCGSRSLGSFGASHIGGLSRTGGCHGNRLGTRSRSQHPHRQTRTRVLADGHKLCAAPQAHLGVLLKVTFGCSLSLVWRRCSVIEHPGVTASRAPRFSRAPSLNAILLTDYFRSSNNLPTQRQTFLHFGVKR